MELCVEHKCFRVTAHSSDVPQPDRPITYVPYAKSLYEIISVMVGDFIWISLLFLAASPTTLAHGGLFGVLGLTASRFRNSKPRASQTFQSPHCGWTRHQCAAAVSSAWPQPARHITMLYWHTYTDVTYNNCSSSWIIHEFYTFSAVLAVISIYHAAKAHRMSL